MVVHRPAGRAGADRVRRRRRPHDASSDGRRFEAAWPPNWPLRSSASRRSFASLPRWITARPGASAAVHRRRPGWPRTLVDQGWNTDYTDYTGEAPDALPRKIDVQRGGHPPAPDRRCLNP